MGSYPSMYSVPLLELWWISSIWARPIEKTVQNMEDFCPTFDAIIGGCRDLGLASSWPFLDRTLVFIMYRIWTCGLDPPRGVLTLMYIHRYLSIFLKHLKAGFPFWPNDRHKGPWQSRQPQPWKPRNRRAQCVKRNGGGLERAFSSIRKFSKLPANTHHATLM